MAKKSVLRLIWKMIKTWELAWRMVLVTSTLIAVMPSSLILMTNSSINSVSSNSRNSTYTITSRVAALLLTDRVKEKLLKPILAYRGDLTKYRTMSRMETAVISPRLSLPVLLLIFNSQWWILSTITVWSS